MIYYITGHDNRIYDEDQINFNMKDITTIDVSSLYSYYSEAILYKDFVYDELDDQLVVGYRGDSFVEPLTLIRKHIIIIYFNKERDCILWKLLYNL